MIKPSAFAIACVVFASLSGAIAADSNGFSTQQICKAGMGTIMGRNPGTMRATKSSNGVVRISYVRPDDGKKFSYKCKIQGNRIVWGSIDGRWRVRPADSKVTYVIEGDQINVTDDYGDGSATRKQFSRKQIGG